MGGSQTVIFSELDGKLIDLSSLSYHIMNTNHVVTDEVAGE